MVMFNLGRLRFVRLLATSKGFPFCTDTTVFVITYHQLWFMKFVVYKDGRKQSKVEVLLLIP
ncbi:hypothetical protein DRO97_10785 [Archaeoglobales archaeon]|nr:MAG: hypothetical protein DRO97_10785 [Archaeoglobales archaeon]